MRSLAPSLAAVALLLSAASAAAEADDATVALMAVGGFGDVGRLEPDRAVLSANNTLGASLRIVWEDRPAPPAWWSIRIGLPRGASDYDALEFDLRVEETDDQAQLSVFLAESDDDRWVCYGARLAELPRGEWLHVVVPRDAMGPWLIGNGVADWDALRVLAIEPGGGKATFHLDGLALSRADDGARRAILDGDDDGYEPLGPAVAPQPEPSAGRCYFPFDGGRLSVEAYLRTPGRLGEIVGAVGTPIAGYTASLPRERASLAAEGIPSIYYSSFSSGYAKYLTRRQAWDVCADGRSLNFVHPMQTTWDGQHTISYAHPAVTEALSHKADALLAAGLGTWMVVDYTFPWFDGWWGYSDAMREAYRADLAGADEGLFLRGRAEPLRFAEYFRSYNGFAPTPADLGLSAWSEFEPPRSDEPDSPRQRARVATWFTLRSYEWLKLPDRVGRRMRDGGGNPLWIVPNPEDSYGSSDYAYLVRSQGVGNLFPEWFGCIGWAAEAGYASLPPLRETADEGGCRLSIIQETGAGGHAAPYLDWRAAYCGVYALAAAGRLDDFDNDFLDQQPFASMSDPAQGADEFARFRDGVAKALAFRQARAETARRPATDVLCVAGRPPAYGAGSIYFGLDQPHSLAPGLSRAHVRFDLRDSLDLERVLDRYRVVFYSPRAPRRGDLARLRAWLEGGEGRVLVTHSFVPTRDAAEWWHFDGGPGLGGGDGRLLGLGSIGPAAGVSATVTEATDPWAAALPVGATLRARAPLTTCAEGRALIAGEAGALLTEARVGRGRVLYLHWSPGSLDGDVESDLWTAAATELGLPVTGSTDAECPVQVFDVPGGRSVLAWDAPAMRAWSFEYRPGIAPLAFAAPDSDHTVALPEAGAGAVVYDFWRDEMATGPALRLEGDLAGLWYVGPDTPEFRATLEAARALRAKLRDLGFDAAP